MAKPPTPISASDHARTSEERRIMKRIGFLAVSVVLALSVVAVAHAGTATGTTDPIGPAFADTPLQVEVTINTTAPVVPYEYSLINKCWFSGKTSGPSDSYERFDLPGPWFEPSPGDPPTTIETVNVQPVPAGAKCKVYIIKNNTVVKGSTTTYSVS
jgi:hypothetical protein